MVLRKVGLRGLRVDRRRWSRAVVVNFVGHLAVSFSIRVLVNGLREELTPILHLVSLVQFFGPPIHSLDRLSKGPFGG
eukprot:8654064-Heterocapsa_arctica.AAC.1